ncbi:ATP-binding protein [Bacillus sp. PS06]|uniref:ATP-binding protein n=1 Tax=Bacillus sp. PS06 TaxID=2764176 RepID=UPI00177B9918|nr:AAA family ATPase [Bacillus sp. PS06]MBD8067729.1 AAA family ATPase [Bacillus sp. PS06]
MKVIGLQIYGYGKFENKEFKNLSPSIQVFFGKNEAGKSTLMSYILSILFGFPTKQQSEQRYEPKTSQSYGGKVIIDTDIYGEIMIERLPGKAAGDVTVLLKDGSIHGEEMLQELLSNMDRNDYQSIYSFNVHGLQEIQQVGADDLGRYLISSGAIGTDALVSIQYKLEKELEGLFKPNGRRPLLNAELLHLKELQQKVKKLQDKNDTYYTFVEQKEFLQKELQTIEQRIFQYQKNLNTLEMMQSIKPLQLEKYKLIEGLEALPTHKPFPVDGLKRLDTLLSQLQPYKVQLSSLTERKLEWEQRLKDIQLDEHVLSCEREILTLNRLRKSYEENQQKLIQLTNSYQKLLEEIERERELGQIYVDEVQLMSFDTGLAAKESIKQATTNIEALRHQKKLLDQSFNEVKEALEECDLTIKSYKQELLSEEERRTLEEQLQSYKSRHHIASDKERLVKEIEQIDQKLTKQKLKQKKQSKKALGFYIPLVLVLLVVAIYFINTQEWGLAIITIGSTILIPILYQNISKSSTNGILSHLIEDKNSRIKQLNEIHQVHDSTSLSISDYERAEMKRSKDAGIRQLLEVELAKQRQLERSYNRVITQFEGWEKEYYQVNDTMKQLCEKYLVQSNSDHLMELFDCIVRLKRCFRDKKAISKEMNIIKNQVEEFHKVLQVVGEATQVEINLSEPIITLEKINRLWEQEEINQEILNSTTDKLKEIGEDYLQLQIEVNVLTKEIEALMNEANVETEEEFRKKGRAEESANRMKERLLLVEAQIPSDLFNTELFDEFDDYELKKLELEQQAKQEQQKLKELQRRLSDINIRMEEIEEGGLYSEVFHEYQLAKSNFQEQAKGWAIYAVAKDLLARTIQQYRDVRLPQLLKTAERYLEILTNGMYVRLYAEEGKAGFTVERKDGLRFSPSELSQATAEQIYVAVRFALAKNMQREHNYPFIIDDSFVNFDAERLQNVVMLINEIAKEHQVLFFTCHEHVLSQFHQEACLILS